jgi:hypothetical protein
LTWWIFEAWEEPFQNWNLLPKLSFIIMNGFDFKFHAFFLIHCCESCALESS